VGYNPVLKKRVFLNSALNVPLQIENVAQVGNPCLRHWNEVCFFIQCDLQNKNCFKCQYTQITSL